MTKFLEQLGVYCLLVHQSETQFQPDSPDKSASKCKRKQKRKSWLRKDYKGVIEAFHIALQWPDEKIVTDRPHGTCRAENLEIQLNVNGNTLVNTKRWNDR